MERDMNTDDFDCTIRVRLPEGGSYTDADFREAVEIALSNRHEELRVQYIGTSLATTTEERA
jgi:hypothetical protein